MRTLLQRIVQAMREPPKASSRYPLPRQAAVREVLLSAFFFLILTAPIVAIPRWQRAVRIGPQESATRWVSTTATILGGHLSAPCRSPQSPVTLLCRYDGDGQTYEQDIAMNRSPLDEHPQKRLDAALKAGEIRLLYHSDHPSVAYLEHLPLPSGMMVFMILMTFGIPLFFVGLAFLLLWEAAYLRRVQ